MRTPKTTPKADEPTRGTIKTIRQLKKAIWKPYEHSPEADGPTRGTIPTIRKPYNLQHHRKTITRRPRKPIDQRGGTIKTIRKPYKPIRKPYENDPESRRTYEGRPLKPYENLGNHRKTIRKTSRKPMGKGGGRLKPYENTSIP